MTMLDDDYADNHDEKHYRCKGCGDEGDPSWIEDLFPEADTKIYGYDFYQFSALAKKEFETDSANLCKECTELFLEEVKFLSK